jgi:hypothetical protein
MPDLASKTLFSGGSAIHPTDLGNSEVTNFNTSVDARLREQYKWKGQALGAVGLTLSADNEKVMSGQFITRGMTKFKELRFPCRTLWPDCNPEIVLSVNIPALDIFTFEQGGLWSELVPSVRIVHSFHKPDSSVVLADERRAAGVGDFSARMVCQISSTSDGRKGIVVKFVILLFPASAEELNDAPETQLPGWPGIKAYEGTFGVVPKPTVPWQCPILPFVRPGVPFSELAMAPSGDKIRWAVAAIMRKCGQPVALGDGRAVLERWQQIRLNPRLADMITPITTWPAVILAPEPEGKNFSILYSNSVFHVITPAVNNYL